MSEPNQNPVTPEQLANQLFDVVLPMCNNDPRETVRQVIMFLGQSLIYAIASSTADETARKAVLKSVGEMIIEGKVPTQP
jgi:hypothetical protein